MVVFLYLLIIIVVVIVVVQLLRHAFADSTRSGREDVSISMLQNQINASSEQTRQQMETLRQSVTDSIQNLASQVNQSLSSSHETVGNRLDATNRVIGDVRQQLGQLEQSSKQLVELSQDIVRLEDILQPPKARGILGELILGEMLAEMLPAHNFRLQHVFKGGEIVDAVIILRAGLVPIDAKFPLDNFRRVLEAPSEDDRRAMRKAFLKDVKIHVDAIARKYIRTDESTFDFALMYIPAENVYYETIIRDPEEPVELALFHYAIQKHVIPVSPNSFYVYLQTIVLGLRGLQVEERSREILDNLSRLQKEFDLFAESFRLLGQHLDNSMKKYVDAQTRLSRVEVKVEATVGLARGLESATDDSALPPQA
jgi:DNA recombination protein RmuC